MFRPVLTRNDQREPELYVVPETELEEKFVVWFSAQSQVPQRHFQGKLSLQFPPFNDPDETAQHVDMAYQEYQKKFHYVEIPRVVGMSFDDATRALSDLGLHWAIEKEVPPQRGLAPGTVVYQNPTPQTNVVMHSVVYIDVTDRKEPP